MAFRKHAGPNVAPRPWPGVLTRELELLRTRFHDLRHAHATQLLAAGVHPEPSPSSWDTPPSRSPWDVYSAVIPSMGRAAADAADTLFGQEGGR